MKLLRHNWWKLIMIVLFSVLVRILLLQLIPLRSSSTFALPPSDLSQIFGVIPVAALFITITYAVIASVLIILQAGISGGKIRRMLICSVPFGLLWILGVLESVPGLGKPFLPEFLIGLTDIVPLLILGIAVSLWFNQNEKQAVVPAGRSPAAGIPIIACSYFIGRYFLYAIIRVNSGYFTNDVATFLWTLAMGLAIGFAYFLLRDGVPGNTPWRRSLWFGGVAFGLYWILNNFFLPILFDMSFIQFTPTIGNYIYRAVIDIIFVSAGVYLFEFNSAA
jgi:hypothetical protein